MQIRMVAILLLYPYIFFGQNIQVVADPVTSGARLLVINDKTILVHQMDVNTGAQKWVSFDSLLNVTAIKRMITPDPDLLASQVYMEGSGTVIRVDQFIFDDQVQVAVFAFDTDGNLSKSQEINFPTSEEQPLYPIPFYVAQSPDKKTFSLVQAVTSNDSLQLRAVVFSEDLDVITNNFFAVPFNTEIFDFYAPLVTDKGIVSVITGEKFDSYRLNSVLNCFYLLPERTAPSKMELVVNRKKLKDLQIFSIGDTVVTQARYSHSTEKETIAGVMFAGFDLETGQPIQPLDLSFSATMDSELKKVFAAEGRKGRFVNYLSVFPANFSRPDTLMYGYLMPAHENGAVKNLANPRPDIERFQQIKTEVVARQSLVGTPGFGGKPMNVAQANAAAGAFRPQADLSSLPSNKESKGRRVQPLMKDLISFIQEENRLMGTIFKLKTERNQLYNFFSYYNTGQSYGAVYYSSPTFGLPVFSSATIDGGNKLVEKKLFEDKNKVILGDLPFLIRDGYFLGFYEDQLSREIGVLKIRM